MIQDPIITRVERNGYMQNQRMFIMGNKCKCGSVATREFKGKPVCMFCHQMILKGVRA